MVRDTYRPGGLPHHNHKKTTTIGQTEMDRKPAEFAAIWRQYGRIGHELVVNMCAWPTTRKVSVRHGSETADEKWPVTS